MNIYYKKNDAIKGERISCEFRKCGKPALIHGSQKQRGKRLVLYNAFCVIEKPIKITT
jgi:hypothetical protein